MMEQLPRYKTMQLYNPTPMNELFAKIISAFFGGIVGLATLARIHIPIPFLSWFPVTHFSDVVVVLIGMFKAGLMGASSWVAVTGMQHTWRGVRRKWHNHFKSKNNKHE
jgi:hypothetical protein